MKKLSPYILPAVVVLLVFVLVARWYSQRPARVEEQLFGEGVQIENLTETEIQAALRGVGDIATVELQPTQPESSVSGVIRYNVEDGKVRFTVSTDLPATDREYSVWLKEVGGTAVRKAFTLTEMKGGLLGSAALPTTLLPFEVLVTDQPALSGDNLQGVLLKATLEKPVETTATPEASGTTSPAGTAQ